MLKVVHFRRHAFSGSYSIEGLFDVIAGELQKKRVDVQTQIAPLQSKGIFARVKNVFWAWSRRGPVNHITGDIHYIALGLPYRNTLLTIHDLEMLDRLNGWKRAILKLFWFDLPLRQVSAVTVISQATKDRLLELTQVTPGKVHVIPNAVGRRFQPVTKPFNVGYPRILHIGTKQNKNLERTIEALSGIKCHLEIVGRLSEAHCCLLRKHSIDYTNRFNLSDQELLECYQNCDLLCFASLVEGFGMPIIEAQWVERPVITSNCSSMPEVAGHGAYLVDPFDVKSIRDAVLSISQNASLREELIQAGRENRARFEATKIADMYLNLYQKLVAC